MADGHPCQMPGQERKSQTSWTLEHFWITMLDTRWSQKGRPLKNDRLLVCKRLQLVFVRLCSPRDDVQSRHTPPDSPSDRTRLLELALDFGDLPRSICGSFQTETEHGAGIDSVGGPDTASHLRWLSIRPFKASLTLPMSSFP